MLSTPLVPSALVRKSTISHLGFYQGVRIGLMEGCNEWGDQEWNETGIHTMTLPKVRASHAPDLRLGRGPTRGLGSKTRDNPRFMCAIIDRHKRSRYRYASRFRGSRRNHALKARSFFGSLGRPASVQAYQ